MCIIFKRDKKEKTIKYSLINLIHKEFDRIEKFRDQKSWWRSDQSYNVTTSALKIDMKLKKLSDSLSLSITHSPRLLNLSLCISHVIWIVYNNVSTNDKLQNGVRISQDTFLQQSELVVFTNTNSKSEEHFIRNVQFSATQLLQMINSLHKSYR